MGISGCAGGWKPRVTWRSAPIALESCGANAARKHAAKKAIGGGGDLSVRDSCRIRGRPTFPLLVEAVSCLFNGETPDLSWITPHESLPVCSTP